MKSAGLLLIMIFAVAFSGCSEAPPLSKAGEVQVFATWIQQQFPALAPALDDRLLLQSNELGFQPVLSSIQKTIYGPGNHQHRLLAEFPLWSGGELRLSSGSLTIGVKALHTQNVLAARGPRTLLYQDAYSSADSFHVAHPERIEEFILLRDARAPRRFSYEVRVIAGAGRIREKAGVVEVVDAEGVAWLRLEQPYLLDANQVRHKASATLRGRTLSIQIPEAARNYPLLLDPAWTTTGTMTKARSHFPATLLASGRVLVSGGHGNSGLLDIAELYDPATGTWTANGSMIKPRRSHSAMLLKTGKVLIMGGYEPLPGFIGGKPIFKAELYDPATGISAYTGIQTVPYGEITAVMLQSGKVLVSGGASGLALKIAYLYDPGTPGAGWTPTGNLNQGRGDHTATLLASGKVLVTGGDDGSGMSSRSSAELYDEKKGTWTLTGSMNNSRSGHHALLLQSGKVLVSGGWGNAEIYDPSTGVWSLTPKKSVKNRLKDAAVVLKSGQVLLMGGESNFVELNSVESYDPVTNSWTTIKSMNKARGQHAAVLLTSGKVLVAGGYTASTADMAEAELYDPTAGSSCTKDSECTSGHCVDAICCQTACQETCKKCTLFGGTGKCLFVPKGSTDAAAKVPCAGTGVCDGKGTCLLNNGQACAKPGQCASGHCSDGYCCDKACTGTCMTCNLSTAKGTCSAVPGGSPDTNASPPCSGTQVCDGKGSCKLKKGQLCKKHDECVTGNCMDYYCCDTLCATRCYTCGLKGQEGTCSFTPGGTQDTNATQACTGTSVCDGKGNCLAISGQKCGKDNECYSDSCVDGYCCNIACKNNCERCDLLGFEGKCMPSPAGQDPDKDCIGVDKECGGKCNGKGKCDYPGVGTDCGTCKACDGTGRCYAKPIDDTDCGVIDCDLLDTKCRDYKDLKTDRCEIFGKCKEPNNPATCKTYASLCSGDAGADATVKNDASAGPDQGNASTPPEDQGCDCRISGGPRHQAPDAFLLLVMAMVFCACRPRKRSP